MSYNFCLRRSVAVGLFIFAMSALLSIAAEAAPLAELGAAMAWEKQTDGLNYQSNMPFTARAGWSFYDLDALLEYATFSRQESESGGAVQFTERQMSLWARKVFTVSVIAKPYVGFGLGARWEELQERFMGQEETTSGRPRWLAAIAGGAFIPVGWGFVLEGEARLSASPGYAPNPQMSVSALLGYRF